MVDANPLLEAVNSGEFSPRMEGRVNFERYPNAAKMCRNMLLLPQGGMTRRPGSRYLTGVKDSSKNTTLIPAQFSETDAYMVENGDEYMRFFKNQAQITVADTDAAITNGTFASNISGWTPSTAGVTTDGSQQTSTADATTYSFASVPIGLSAITRKIGICIYGANVGSTAAKAISAVAVTTGSIGSFVSSEAEIVVQASGTATGHRVVVGIAQLEWPTSATTATIAVQFSGAMTQCAIKVFPIYTLATKVLDTASASGASANDSLATKDNSVVIGCFGGYASGGAISGTGWTNLTEDDDAAVEGQSRFSTAYAEVTTGSSLSITAARSGGGGNETYLMVAACFGTQEPEADSGVMALNPVSPDYDVVTAEQFISIGASYTSAVHVLRFDVGGIYGTKVGVRIGSGPGLQDILEEVECRRGSHAIEFTPGTQNFVLTFITRAGAIPATIDNVSFIDNAALEINTPYDETDLDELRSFQAGDVVYLLHQEYEPRRLERRGDRSWSLALVDFEDGPYLPANDQNSVNQRIENPFFENGLKGWTDASTGDGNVFHTAVGAELDDGTSGGSGVANLRTAFAVADGDVYYWLFHILITNQAATLNIGTSAGGTDIVSAQAVEPGWTALSVKTAASAINIELTISGHTGERTGVGAVLAYGTKARLIEASDTTGEITLISRGFAPFASTDVGRLIRLTAPGREAGYAVITGYYADTAVTATVLRDLGGAETYDDWAFGAFGGDQGYPRCLGFFDGRLIVGSTAGKPQTIWASQSGDLQNMRPDSYVSGVNTVQDDDAITVTLNSKRRDDIVTMAELDALLLLTEGAQWIVASAGGVISPSDIYAKVNSAIPSGDLEVVQVDQSMIFADKTKRELYEISFSTEEGGYIPQYLNILADHIFRSPAHQLVYQRRPESILWCPREDGRVAALSYNRVHRILGWSQQIMGGAFSSGDAVVEHMAVVPGAAATGSQVYDSDNRDEVWMVVKRTINGNTVRYIEVLEGEFEGPLREDYETERAWWAAMRTAQADAFYVDSGITYSGSATATITGLSHLEGETVKVLADGKVHPDCVVSSGQISLNYTASKVQVGLSYTSKYLSLKLPVGAAQGTSVNKVKAITGCGVVVVDTGAFDIATVEHTEEQGRVFNRQYTFEFRMNAMRDLGEATPLYTGESYKNLENSNSTDPRLYIETSAPLPLTVLGLAPHMRGTDET